MFEEGRRMDLGVVVAISALVSIGASAAHGPLTLVPQEKSFQAISFESQGALGLMGIESAHIWAPGSAESQPAPISCTQSPSAIAVDLGRGLFWIAGDRGLSAHSLDGQPLLSAILEAPGLDMASLDGIRRHLAVHSADGSLWVGAGSQLWNLTTGGLTLRHRALDEPIVTMALDSASSELIIATSTGIQALDAVTGEELRIFQPPSELGEITAMALSSPPIGEPSEGTEPVSNDKVAVWLAIDGQIVGFSAAGDLLVRRQIDREVSISALTTGSEGGVWWLSGPEVGHYRPENDHLSFLTPFGPAEGPGEIGENDAAPTAAELTALHFDISRQSLWVAAGSQLTRLSLSGWILELHDVGVPVTDLAVVEPAIDNVPPSLFFRMPEPGEIVFETRPEIRLAYHDQGAGIDAGSLVIQAAGTELAMACSYFQSEVRCRPNAPLPEGAVVLKAAVRDVIGNLSSPATRSFRVDPSSAGGGDVEGGIGSENIYTPVASPRGIRPNQPYQFGGIDAIDTASGNVTLRVPLGQVYEVGPMIRYQFMAVNNSNAWDYVPVPCPSGDSQCDTSQPPTYSLPSASSNAGLGWELHFGKLYAPIPPAGLDATNFSRWPAGNADPSDQNNRWLYVAPDGARHFLYSLPGRDNGTANNPKRYSKDGTYLRLWQTESGLARVGFPDGRYSVFEKTDSAIGTDFCGGGISGCWRFKEMVDPYGNKMSVDYLLSGITESWVVDDSTGRSHVIRFDTSNTGTGGGDGGGTYATQDGDEWGDLRRKVTQVELAAFAATATYTFTYTTATVGRSCAPNPGQSATANSTITTKVLTSISVPDARPYFFTTNTSSATGCGGETRGRITQVTLPTLGEISYTYGSTWDFPTRCNYSSQADSTAPASYRGVGITAKTRNNADNSFEGSWSYSSELFPGNSTLTNAGPGCTRANYRKTIVDGPTNTDGNHVRTVSYNSVHAGPKSPSSSASGIDWQVTDQGLPYSKHAGVGSGIDRLFLSSESFLCGGSCGTAKTTTYRRYISEYRQCNKFNGDGDSADCFQINPMQLAERTVYNDDGGRYIESRGSGLDGAGHFRTQTTTDTFDGTTIRSSSTQYNATGTTALGINGSTGYVQPGTPSIYLPTAWILTPYTKVSRSEGGRTYLTETVFNNQGSLTCSRTRTSSSARTSQDRVVKLSLGNQVGTNAGLPVAEEVSGGEFSNLSTESVCPLDTNSANGRYYRFDNAYADLQLKSSRIGSFPYRYRAEINQATGLPSMLYNGADEGETLSFDRLGRLTSSVPDASRNEATTEYVYNHPASESSSVTVKRKNGGSELTNETAIYDNFGRLVRQVRANPVGEAGDYLSDQHTEYDHADNVVRQTTRQLNGAVNLNHSWRFQNFDVFGRAETLTAPDGQVTTMDYFGIRAEKRTAQVHTPTGDVDRSITTTRDALDRTVKIATTEHVTTHVYDPNSRMVSASRAVPGGTAQERNYGFDARGYLLFAELPEITGNSGFISYKPDALGLSWQTKDGQHGLTWAYDNDGRPVSLRDTEPGGKLWKTWTYGTANSGSNKQKGRLIDAVRYNYPPLGEDVAIHEVYRHEGGTAGPSRLDRQVRWLEREGNAQWGATLQTTFAYDKLGNMTSMGYPACVANTPSQGSAKPCADGDDLQGPAHSATWTYNKGLMRRATSSLGPSAVYNYHHNLQLASTEFSNGVVGTYTRGTNGLVRPSRRVFSQDAATLFDTGNYFYDATGNIKTIGLDDYTYDGASRLRTATVRAAGLDKIENYTYNTTDSMVGMESDLVGDRAYNVDTATNRLLGVGTGVEDWSYDGAGNVTAALGTVFQFSWDSLNMQTRYQDPSIDHISVYGPGDFRVWVEDSATGVKHWTSRGPAGEILREYEVASGGAAWTLIRDYLHGAEGAVATWNRNGTTRYFHTDHLGTPRLFTTAIGSKLSEHHYYPFGIEANEDKTLILADGFESGELTAWFENQDELGYKFTGHQRELHKNADYMLGRHYLNVVSRFASVDPARDGWNLYAYVGNRPLRFVDPDGLEVVEPRNKRARRAFRNLASTPAGAEAIRVLDRAEGTYEFESSRTSLSPRERFQAKHLGKTSFKKKAGHFAPRIKPTDGKMQAMSGGAINLDFGTVDSAGEEPYSGDFGDEALLAHEIGHALAHEQAEDRWAYHLSPYERKEKDADELRDKVVEQLEQEEDQ